MKLKIPKEYPPPDKIIKSLGKWIKALDYKFDRPRIREWTKDYLKKDLTNIFSLLK